MSAKGFTLAELMISVAVVTVALLGTVTATVAAARMARTYTGPDFQEATACAQQETESYRDRVAADDTTLSNPVGLGTWQAGQPLSNCGLSGTESIEFKPGRPAVTPATRVCRVARECDGLVGNDCYAILVRVCWNGQICPAVGSACQ